MFRGMRVGVAYAGTMRSATCCALHSEVARRRATRTTPPGALQHAGGPGRRLGSPGLLQLWLAAALLARGMQGQPGAAPLGDLTPQPSHTLACYQW